MRRHSRDTTIAERRRIPEGYGVVRRHFFCEGQKSGRFAGTPTRRG